ARVLHATESLDRLGEALDLQASPAQLQARAGALGSIDEDVLTALANHGRKSYLAPDAQIDSVGRAILADDDALRAHVLASTHMQIYPCGREDIAAGAIDRRILEVLEYLAFNHLDPVVSSLRCGHGYYTSA